MILLEERSKLKKNVSGTLKRYRIIFVLIFHISYIKYHLVRLQKPKPHEAAAKLQANGASYAIQIQSEYESDSYDNRRLLLDWILDSLPCLLFN